MNRKERRRREKTLRASGGKPAGGIAIPQASGVANALMGYASGGAAAPLAFGDADLRTILEQAVRMLQSGRLKEAETGFRSVLNLEFDNPVARQLLGVTLYQGGAVEEGVALIEQVLEQTPDYAEAHHNLGLINIELGDVTAAAERFALAVEHQPDYIDAYLNLGNARLLLGDQAGARRAFEEVIERDRDHVDGRANLAALKLQTGDAAGALGDAERATRLAPNHAIAQNGLGKILAALGRGSEARAAYKKAHEAAPQDKGFEGDYLQAMSQLIPAWHFPMLADQGRNDAFEAAIARAVTPETHLLDIGSGAGLLSLMAARAGAAHVTAVETVPELAQVTRDVAAANGFGDRIEVLQTSSTALDGNKDLVSRADVVVAEIFDGGLLGEGAIPTLRHAKRQLARPGAVFIPAAATVYGRLVELPAHRDVNPVAEIAGFDLSAMERFRNPMALRSLDLEHEEVGYLSETIEIARFDFTDLPLTSRNRRAVVEVSAAGELQAIAIWFDLHLDRETTVSSGPGGAMRHWRQAVRFFDLPRQVQAGDKVEILISHSESNFHFELL